MSKVRTSYDDEIDMFELFETLWRGKRLISAVIAIFVISGLVYSQLAKPKFEVSVSYDFKIFSLNSQQYCNGKISCISSMNSKQLNVVLANTGWNSKNIVSKIDKGSKLVLNTNAPVNVKTHNDFMEKVNQLITNKIYNEALNEVAIISTEMNNALLKSERVANNKLKALRIIQAIDNGQKAIYFSPFVIKKTSPKTQLILVFSILLGGFISVVFVLVNNVIRKRKEIASKV